MDQKGGQIEQIKATDFYRTKWHNAMTAASGSVPFMWKQNYNIIFHDQKQHDQTDSSFKYTASLYRQFSQLWQPEVLVNLLTCNLYQEHQISGWHNIISERNEFAEPLFSKVLQN